MSCEGSAPQWILLTKGQYSTKRCYVRTASWLEYFLQDSSPSVPWRWWVMKVPLPSPPTSYVVPGSSSSRDSSWCCWALDSSQRLYLGDLRLCCSKYNKSHRQTNHKTPPTEILNVQWYNYFHTLAKWFTYFQNSMIDFLLVFYPVCIYSDQMQTLISRPVRGINIRALWGPMRLTYTAMPVHEQWTPWTGLDRYDRDVISASPDVSATNRSSDDYVCYLWPLICLNEQIPS